MGRLSEAKGAPGHCPTGCFSFLRASAGMTENAIAMTAQSPVMDFGLMSSSQSELISSIAGGAWAFACAGTWVGLPAAGSHSFRSLARSPVMDQDRRLGSVYNISALPPQAAERRRSREVEKYPNRTRPAVTCAFIAI